MYKKNLKTRPYLSRPMYIYARVKSRDSKSMIASNSEMAGLVLVLV